MDPTNTTVGTTPNQDLNMKNEKRYRSAFTTNQIRFLENQFRSFPYVGVINRKEIAKVLNISEKAIKIWFQNRRRKEKKDVIHKELHYHGQNKVNAIKFVNDQLNYLSTLQQSNDHSPNSMASPITSTTHFNELSVDSSITNKEKILKITTPVQYENNRGKYKYDEGTRRFRSNVASDCAKNTQISNGLSKQLTTNMMKTEDKKIIKTECFHHVRKNLEKSLKSNKQPKMLQRDTYQNLKQQNIHNHKYPRNLQVPSGYVSFMTNKSYPQPCVPTGNILLTPVTSCTPSHTFTFISIPDHHNKRYQLIPHSVKLETPKYCNCHMNQHDTSVAFTYHKPQAQYLIAVPM